VQLGNRDRLLAFCAAVQKRCPVGAYIRPVAGATSGYGDEVIQRSAPYDRSLTNAAYSVQECAIDPSKILS